MDSYYTRVWRWHRRLRLLHFVALCSLSFSPGFSLVRHSWGLFAVNVSSVVLLLVGVRLQRAAARRLAAAHCLHPVNVHVRRISRAGWN